MPFNFDDLDDLDEKRGGPDLGWGDDLGGPAGGDDPWLDFPDGDGPGTEPPSDPWPEPPALPKGGRDRTRRGGGYRAPKPRRTAPPVNIPWRFVWPVLCAAAVIAACVLFRTEISAFLEQVLTWVLTIVVIVVILRILFGGRRRRW